MPFKICKVERKKKHNCNTLKETLKEMLTKRSEVWKYFEQIGEKNVQCKLCDMKFAYHKSTSSMQNHMKLKLKEKILE